jgi:polar amino acid transport system substrate-binding protein
MIRNIPRFFASMLLGACASATVVPPAAVADLAPTGKLRAVINLGNPVLASKDEATGQPRGVSVDLARELARRLGLGSRPRRVPSAGEAVDALANGRVDVGFFAIDRARWHDGVHRAVCGD